MRRTAILIIVTLVVGLLQLAAWAGERGLHITVDDEVTQGRRLHIEVRDCVSGDDWTATIEAALRDRQKVIRQRAFPVDSDRTTKIGFRISSAAFEPGRYKATIACKHSFNDGSAAIYFDEWEPFFVVRRN
ncbi:MAG TPA: hypothetical protein VFK59_03020 [Actinomycetota bacterium]|nr:hypothetical protein [Actinomycetota bacterium]